MSGNYPDGVNQQIFDEAHDGMDEPELDYEDEFDCHMGADGQCGMAGSEDCDFECPVMAGIIRLQRNRKKKS